MLTATQWIQITIADIQASRSGPLVLGFQTTALAPGQPDPVPVIIAQVTEEIIGSIGFSGRYTMDASYGSVNPNVIPPNLKDLAVEKICRKLKGRFTGSVGLTTDEREDEKDYERKMSLIRDGRYPIDVTNNPGNNLSVRGGSVVAIQGQRTQFRASQLRNLC